MSSIDLEEYRDVHNNGVLIVYLGIPILLFIEIELTCFFLVEVRQLVLQLCSLNDSSFNAGHFGLYRFHTIGLTFFSSTFNVEPSGLKA